MEKAFLDLDNVAKEYIMGESQVHALKDVNISISKGEFIVMLGPSGSGKTTFLNVVGGLDSVTSGSIRINGEDITNYNKSQLTDFRCREIGFVFQFFNLIPTLTAFENVHFAVELSGEKDRSIAMKALEDVGLGDRADHFPGQLSGGEQQRVAIARAISKNAPLLLCDEPTGELDYESGVNVLKLLRRINSEDGNTVVLVTHNSAIADMADRVIHMHSGAVAEITEVTNPVDATEIRW